MHGRHISYTLMCADAKRLVATVNTLLVSSTATVKRRQQCDHAYYNYTISDTSPQPPTHLVHVRRAGLCPPREGHTHLQACRVAERMKGKQTYCRCMRWVCAVPSDLS